MTRKFTLVCDYCGKEIEKVVAKLYLAPILPGKTIQSYQSQYTHHGDLCSDCVVKFEGKLKKRQSRSSNGKVTQLKGRRETRTKRAS